MRIRRILALSICCGLGPTFLGCGERGGVDALPPGSEAVAETDGAGSAASKASRKSKRRALIGAPGPLPPPRD